MSDKSHYVPRVFTQDAVCLDRHGKVTALVGVDWEDERYLVISPCELTSAGVKKALHRHLAAGIEDFINHHTRGSRNHSFAHYEDVSFDPTRGITYSESSRPIEYSSDRSKRSRQKLHIMNEYYKPIEREVVRRFVEAEFQDIEANTAPFIEYISNKLPKKIPSLVNPETLVATLEATIEQALSPRLKRFAIEESPLIFVANATQKLHKDHSPKATDLGTCFDTNTDHKLCNNFISITTEAVGMAYAIQEEMEHALNKRVGFDMSQWMRAAKEDFKSDTALAFMEAHASKNTNMQRKHVWTKDYHEDDHGVEALAELNYIYEKWVATGTHEPENAMQIIESAMPQCGKLFRGYKQDEHDYFESLAARDRGDDMAKRWVSRINRTAGIYPSR